MPTKNERIGAFLILVGTNGTGKSHLQKSLLKYNKRNFIIPANRYDENWDSVPEIRVKETPLRYGKTAYRIPDINKFAGNRKLTIDDDEIFKEICDQDRGFVNGGLFLDDFKNYIPATGRLPRHVNRLFSDRRMKMLDIFGAVHSFQKINPDFFDFDPTLIIFQTTRPINEDLRSKIGNYEQLEEIVNRVNIRSKTPGKNFHPVNNRFYCETFNPAE